ncbi:hypothetical protein Fmac_000330 [Flemingia macrophylla]|uniref:Uncharacterized protein n=1 Tax=Flemingia macrophylla TaxID=520843 RepID=A0ABD1NDY5_9FABA
MGKKKRQKTKELSVAIAQASSKGGDTEQQQQQPHQPPRKRGRPRKVVVNFQPQSDAKQVEPKEPPQPEASTTPTNKQQQELTSSEPACKKIAKEEAGLFQEINIQPSRSRARRKSKPRKST